MKRVRKWGVLRLVLFVLSYWAVHRVGPALRRYPAAVHEAGHAVAVIICGLNLTGVNISQVRKGNGRIQYGKCTSYYDGNRLKRIVIAYAGPIAEAKAYPFLLGRHGGKRDHSQAEECLDELYLAVRSRFDGLTKNLLRKWCKHEARSLVNEHWHSIVKVADELLAKRALTGEEVKALMNRSVMTAKQWLRFHNKHWPPRYD